jgi:hypothetical protein
MPIRLRDANAFVARLRATTADVTASLAGTHVQPANVSGSMVSRLGDITSLIDATFQPAASRGGFIATTLQGASTSGAGTVAPPQIPNKVGPIATTLSGVSCALRGTSAPPQAATFWANWPVMNATCIQGNSLVTSSQYSVIADKDLVIFQSFFPTATRLQLRIAGITAIRALQSAPMVSKFFIYCQPRATFKTVDNPGNNELEINKALIDDPIKGNENWYVHRVNQPGLAGRVENEFTPANQWQCNIAVLVAGNNSLGENYAFAYWKEWNIKWVIGADDIRPLLSGVFQDAVEQCPPPMTQGNGATTVTDQDYNANGVADPHTDYSAGANAGGRFWAEGNLEVKARFESRFPGKYVIPNSAQWDQRPFNGTGSPPLPMSNWPFYRAWELILDEVSNFNFGLRTDGTTGYRFTGGGSTSSFFRSYAIQEKCLKLDANIPTAIGRGAVLCQGTGQDRDPNQDDHEFFRSCSLISLLVERAAPCLQATGQRPYSLDELLVRLGNPIGTRSMGTLNESTLAWTLRTANQSVGQARFYWAEFQEGIVVLRGDSPTSIGPWPSGAGNAVNCTLPPPGSGKKWQRLNAATYVNPVTGRATRNQSPTLNNGADVTTVSLRPLHAVLIRRVNV